MINKETVNIKVEQIHTHPDNPRKELGDLTELAESIKKKGVLQNLTIIPIDGKKEEYYALIGNRRLAAAKLAGEKLLPCRIQEGLDKKEQLSIMLEENMQRNDLTIYEQAQGFQMMLDLGETEDTIAVKTGFSKTTIRHRLNIAKLDQVELEKKEKTDNFQLSLTDLYELEKIKDIKTRDEILKQATNSRDLVWRTQNKVAEIQRVENAKKIVKILKEKGVKEAPKGAENDIYTSKWIIVNEFRLDKDYTEIKLHQDTDNLFYLSQLWMVRVIKKGKNKKVLSPEEEIKVQKEKNKKKIKAEIKDLGLRRTDFIRNIVSEKIKPIKESEKIKNEIWSILLRMNTYLSELTMKQFFTGKMDYECSEEEIKEANEKIDSCCFLYQMLIHMNYGLDNIGDLYAYDGSYISSRGKLLEDAYNILKRYGWSFENEEESLINGSNDLYVKNQ